MFEYPFASNNRKHIFINFNTSFSHFRSNTFSSPTQISVLEFSLHYSDCPSELQGQRWLFYSYGTSHTVQPPDAALAPPLYPRESRDAHVLQVHTHSCFTCSDLRTPSEDFSRVERVVVKNVSSSIPFPIPYNAM